MDPVKITPHNLPDDTIGSYIDDVIVKFKEHGIIAKPKYCISDTGEIISVTLEFVGRID